MTDRTKRQLHLWIGVLVLVAAATAAPAAMATCTMSVSPNDLDFGNKSYMPLPDSQEVSGYKQVGVKTAMLMVACDDGAATRDVMVQALPGQRGDLFAWSPTVQTSPDPAPGALRVAVLQARAGDGSVVPLRYVPNSGTGQGGTTAGPLLLTGPGTLVLDLNGVSASARGAVGVQVQVQTLLKSSGFAPTGATPFTARLDFQTQ